MVALRLAAFGLVVATVLPFVPSPQEPAPKPAPKPAPATKPDDAAKAVAGRREAIAAAEELVIREDRAAGTLVYSLITILSGQYVFAARLEWARAAMAMLDARSTGGNEAVLRAYAKAKKRMMGE